MTPGNRGADRYWSCLAGAVTGATREDVWKLASQKLAELDRLWPEGYGRAAKVDAVYRVLKRPNTATWLVFDNQDGAVGAIWAAGIQPGHTAQLHLGFWDGKLLDKQAAVLDAMYQLYHLGEYTEFDGVRHVSAEIPSHSFGTAWWAVRDLGFGGPFTYRDGRRALPVEGVRTACMPWRGELHDLILLGRHATVDTSEAERIDSREAARRPS